jgi:hypothetical protein
MSGYTPPAAKVENESTGSPESLHGTRRVPGRQQLSGGLRIPLFRVNSRIGMTLFTISGAVGTLPVAHDNGAPLVSLAYPLICSSKPLWLSPRALIGTHRSSRISFDKRRHAPAPRLRCGTSKTSKIACVPIRSTLSSATLPRSRSSRSRQGSAFCAAASLILVSHETIACPHAICR